MAELTYKQRAHILHDVVFITVSITFAVWLAKSDVLNSFLVATKDVKVLESFLAGTLFTSAFTTAPAIAVLGKIAHGSSALTTALFGGVGALFGDLVIFKFVKDRLVVDMEVLFTKPARERFRHIIHARLFHLFSPFVAALIIASPLPDELGVMIFGFLRARTLLFIPFSLLANFAGIFIISGIANVV